jgi:DnaJ like chaperone protein
MSFSAIFIILIIGIIVYAVFSMRRSSAGSEKTSDPGSETGSHEGEQAGSGPSGPGRRRSGRYGKWIGGGLGWAFGGPIGAILGFALGSMFDGKDSTQFFYRGTPRGDFAMSLLVLSAAVMKADKKVVRSELDYVRNFFFAQFGEAETSRLILMLREILKQDIHVRDVSVQVGQYMDYSAKLQLLHYLFGIASADGQFHPDEVSMIEDISGYMGISAGDFTSVRAMFIRNVNWAYDVLEITPGATDDEVKKAYREMAKKHHPDKVAQLGEDIRKSATEKFQQINEAYDIIRKQRGMR